MLYVVNLQPPHLPENDENQRMFVALNLFLNISHH
jgi:hypothetical protein